MNCIAPKWIDAPRVIKKSNGIKTLGMQVGCGKCTGCQVVIKRDMIFRFEEQMRDMPEGCHFLTLTYNDVWLPWTGKLVKSHMRDWKMRVKSAHEKKYGAGGPYGVPGGVKVFYCGEYGTEFGRPHYHALVWNCDEDLARSKWTKGYTYPGKMGIGAMKYVVNYLDKKDYHLLEEYEVPDGLFGDGKKDLKQSDSNLGIGFMDRMETRDVMRYFATGSYKVACNDGFVIELPRYYTKRLDKKFLDEKGEQALTDKKIKKVMDGHDDLIYELQKKGSSLEAHLGKMKRIDINRIKQQKARR